MSGLTVQQVHCLWVKAVLVSLGVSSYAAAPANGSQGGEQMVSRVIMVLDDGDGLVLTPGLMDLLDGWQCTPHDLFCRPHDPLDGFPVLCGGVAIPHGDAARQYALYGAAVEVHKPLRTYATLPESPQGVKALVGLLEHDLRVVGPPKVVGDLKSQETEAVDDFHWSPI